MPLYDAPRGLYGNPGDPAPRRSHQALLALIDPDDPAWPSTVGVLREMADAGVELNEAAVSIAARLGGHRHRLATTAAHHPVNLQAALAAPADGALVYYLRRGDLIKIGTTADPATRMRALMPDDILAVEPGGEDLETARHRQFGHLRRRGEYFYAGPELIEHARQLRARHGDPDPAWASITAKPAPVRFTLPPLTSDETVTVAEAITKLSIKKTTIWCWIRYRMISPANLNSAGHRVYYVQHLVALRDRPRLGR